MMKTISSGDRIFLQNGDMKAEILTPWSTVYQRTRFAHSGFVSGLWLGDVCFTQAELAQAGQSTTGGIGLCSEYKCPKIEMDSAVGAEYLKVGVGVLTRTAEPWTLVDEQLTQGLPTSLRAGSDAAEFECFSPAVNGYAYREKRTLLLQGQRLRQEIELENTGDKVMDISEYCHNFVSLGGIATDETHRLELFGMRKLSREEGGDFLTTDFGAGWAGPVAGSFGAPCEITGSTQPCAWKLSSSRTPVTISEWVDFDSSFIYLWGTSYCVCAEVYKPLVVQPGQTARWSREWRVGR